MNTSARMLRLLSLLQTHRYWPGAELAERLEVSARTLRRDIDRLRALGYPVDAVRGVAGGYQLGAGGQLPPLLLEDEAAVAIAVGLRSAAAGAIGGLQESSLQALTKVVSLMPPRLRRRIDALQSQTTPAPSWGPLVDANALITLAQGCRDDETVRFGYTAREGEATQRHVEPFGLVSLGSRWYLVGWCRQRHDWRSFRVDRISAPALTGLRFRPRELPADDALAYVRSGIRSMPKKYDVRVRFAASVEAVSAAVGRWGTVTAVGHSDAGSGDASRGVAGAGAEDVVENGGAVESGDAIEGGGDGVVGHGGEDDGGVEERSAQEQGGGVSDGGGDRVAERGGVVESGGVIDGGGALLEMQADDFFWPLSVLANIDADFTVESPPELRDAVRLAAARLTRASQPH